MPPPRPGVRRPGGLAGAAGRPAAGTEAPARTPSGDLKEGDADMKPDELRGLWEDRRTVLRKLAEGLPDGREGYAPVPEAMSLAGHILHVVSAEKTAVDALTVTPGKWEWHTGIDPTHFPQREDILSAMDRQSAVTRAYLDGLTPEKLAAKVKLPWGSEPTVEVFWVQWLTHDAHHCGSVVAGMRAGGMVPPNIWG